MIQKLITSEKLIFKKQKFLFFFLDLSTFKHFYFSQQLIKFFIKHFFFDKISIYAFRQ